MALISIIFPSSLGAVLEALKGDISKEESDFQSYYNHDKRLVFFINQQISTMVPEKTVYGSISQSPEKWKRVGPPHHLVVYGGLTSGPQQTQSQKRSVAAPAAASDEEDDEEDEARAEKTKKSPMAAQISTN
jgi:hypothetical protein